MGLKEIEQIIDDVFEQCKNCFVVDHFRVAVNKVLKEKIRDKFKDISWD